MERLYNIYNKVKGLDAPSIEEIITARQKGVNKLFKRIGWQPILGPQKNQKDVLIQWYSRQREQRRNK